MKMKYCTYYSVYVDLEKECEQYREKAEHIQDWKRA